MIFDKKDCVPLRGVFESTLACNLRCKHCGSKAGQKRSDELTIDEIRDLFKQLGALGCQRMTVAGGEPLARSDWSDVIEASTSQGIRTGLLTNGIAFDDEAAAIAKERGLNAVGFSVDGPPEIHDRIRGKVGHYNRLMQAMASARNVELPISIVTFVHTQNIGRLKEMHELIAETGAFAWQIQVGTDMGNLHDNPDLLLRPHQILGLEEEIAEIIAHRKMRVDVADSIGYYGPREKQLRTSVGGRTFSGCQAGVRVIGIESNGNIKGCLSIMAGYNEQGKDFVEGNIREESLEEIWYRPGAFAYNREWSVDDLDGFCKTCRHVKRCRGGCRGRMVASGNGVENPHCTYRIACEEGQNRRSAQVAAVALASVLGGTGVGCSDDDVGPTDAGEDAAVMTDTSVTGEDTSSTDTGGSEGKSTETTVDTPVYGMPTDDMSVPVYGEPIDTEERPDTAITPYGMPDDTEEIFQPVYGMPDTGVDTGEETGKETEEETEDTGLNKDTESAVAVYSAPLDTEEVLPPYGMPMDTDEVVPPYSMPQDTEQDTGEKDTDTIEAVDVYGMPQPLYAAQEE